VERETARADPGGLVGLSNGLPTRAQARPCRRCPGASRSRRRRPVELDRIESGAVAGHRREHRRVACLRTDAQDLACAVISDLKLGQPAILALACSHTRRHEERL
jgi:hypothetical protein